MIRAAFIGAGGIGWTRTLVRDIVSVPELRDTVFALTDIDPARLQRVERVIRNDVEFHELPAQVTATTDRKEALRDADYVINAVRIGGLDMWRCDVEIPLRYGIDQCIGDTLGPGGIMYGQRSVPPVLDFCRDMREVAKPGAWLLNYVNPMSILTWAVLERGGVNVLGLCHGVQHTSRQIARWLGVQYPGLDYLAAGVNHMAWFARLCHCGEDITSKLAQMADRIESVSPNEKVRLDLLRRTGYFPTESSGFAAEMTPWYRKTPEAVMRWSAPGRSHHGGETAGGWRFNTEKERWFEHLGDEIDNALTEPVEMDARTYEHASYIIEAMETGRVYRGCFNVRNQGCIANLPDDAVVETPCFVDRAGVHVPRVGALPDACASICNAMVAPQRLAVKAALTGDVNLLKQSMMLDPLTAAAGTSPEIWRMTDELLVAQAELLPQYAGAIADARARLAHDAELPLRDVWPGTRYHPRTVEEMMSDPECNLREWALRIFTGQHVRAQ